MRGSKTAREFPSGNSRAVSVFPHGARAQFKAKTRAAVNNFIAVEARRERRESLVLFHLADVMLRVEFDTELGDQIDLGLEEIDVMLLVVHQLFEQIAADVVAHAMA